MVILLTSTVGWMAVEIYNCKCEVSPLSMVVWCFSPAIFILLIQTWSKKKLGLTRVSVSSAEYKEGRQQQGNHQNIRPWNLKVGEKEEIFKIALVIPLYLQSCISYLGPGTCHLLSHPTQNLASSWLLLLSHGLILWILLLTLSGISLLSLPTAPASAEASPRQLQQLLFLFF